MIHFKFSLKVIALNILMIACINCFTKKKFNRIVQFSIFSGGNMRDGIGKPKGYADPRIKYVLDKTTGAKSGLPDLSKPFLVLGIETSCDDTGVSVVSSDGRILSNVVYSQYEMHQKFGGIVPGIAMETHKSKF